MKNYLRKSLLGLTFLLAVSCTTDAEVLNEGELSSSSDSELKVSELKLVDPEVGSGERYYIRNLNSGKFLDVVDRGKSNGDNVQQWDLSNGTHQQWTLENYRVGNNDVTRIRNVNSGRLLDVARRSGSNGANVHQWAANNSTNVDNAGNQWWGIVRRNVSKKEYTIHSRRVSKLLEIGAWNKNNGGNLQQWSETGSSGGANQKWRFYVKK